MSQHKDNCHHKEGNNFHAGFNYDENGKARREQCRCICTCQKDEGKVWNCHFGVSHEKGCPHIHAKHFPESPIEKTTGNLEIDTALDECERAGFFRKKHEHTDKCEFYAPASPREECWHDRFYKKFPLLISLSGGENGGSVSIEYIQSINKEVESFISKVEAKAREEGWQSKKDMNIEALKASEQQGIAQEREKWLLAIKSACKNYGLPTEAIEDILKAIQE